MSEAQQSPVAAQAASRIAHARHSPLAGHTSPSSHSEGASEQRGRHAPNVVGQQTVPGPHWEADVQSRRQSREDVPRQLAPEGHSVRSRQGRAQNPSFALFVKKMHCIEASGQGFILSQRRPRAFRVVVGPSAVGPSRSLPSDRGVSIDASIVTSSSTAESVVEAPPSIAGLLSDEQAMSAITQITNQFFMSVSLPVGRGSAAFGAVANEIVPALIRVRFVSYFLRRRANQPRSPVATPARGL